MPVLTHSRGARYESCRGNCTTEQDAKYLLIQVHLKEHETASPLDVYSKQVKLSFTYHAILFET